MSTDTHQLETDQAAREASGGHPYGRYLEEFEVGDVYKHWPAKTVTEADDHLFCLITMNHHPLHLNDVYAAQIASRARTSSSGRSSTRWRWACRSPTSSGKAIANLATEELSHPAPVFHGDTLFSSPRCSRSRSRARSPIAGRSRSTHASTTRTATLVAEFKRLVLVPRKNPGQSGAGARRRTSSRRNAAAPDGYFWQPMGPPAISPAVNRPLEEWDTTERDSCPDDQPEALGLGG